MHALYEQKTVSAAWRSYFASVIKNELGFTSSFADPDVHLLPKTSKIGTKYYAYLIIYVYDVICIDIKPKDTISRIGNIFRIKEGSIKNPKNTFGKIL